jgi:hypothetical protein
MTRKRLHHSCTSTRFTNLLATRTYIPSSQVLPIKFVAADVGFLPPGPAVDFADMLCNCSPFRLNVNKQSHDSAFKARRKSGRLC